MIDTLDELIDFLTSLSIGIGIILVVLWLTGCAGAKRPVRFHAHNVTGIVVNFDKCKMQDDGNFLCNGVIFKVNAIDVSPLPVR